MNGNGGPIICCCAADWRLSPDEQPTQAKKGFMENEGGYAMENVSARKGLGG